MMKALQDSMSRGINEMYENEIKNIDQQDPEKRDLAWMVISWIYRAVVPLTMGQLIEALAVNIAEAEPDPDNIIEPENVIIEACRGLVEIDGMHRKLRFTHVKFSEFLTVSQAYNRLLSEQSIAQVC